MKRRSSCPGTPPPSHCHKVVTNRCGPPPVPPIGSHSAKGASDMSNERNSNRMTRRGALGVITVGVGATVAGVIAVPVAGYIAAPVTEQVTFQAASLGPVTGFTAERGFQPTATPFVEDPAQPLTSSQLAYVHYTGGGSADWLSGDAMFVVFSNRCTHVGCPAQATA